MPVETMEYYEAFDANLAQQIDAAHGWTCTGVYYSCLTRFYTYKRTR
jgi:hypothetical protein